MSRITTIDLPFDELDRDQQRALLTHLLGRAEIAVRDDRQKDAAVFAYAYRELYRLYADRGGVA